MDLEHLLLRFALALGIGLLIGVERGWRTREATPGSRAAGIRTFAISGLLGGVVGAIVYGAGGVASAGGGIVFGIGFATYAAVITTFSRDENRAEKTFSATTAVAGILTFALGAYAVLGDELLAAAAAVVAAGLLAIREKIHGWVESITWPELRSGLVLLAMTFIALPVLPDNPIGPYGGVNPREVWIIAIVLAGVSFLGYAAVKYFGVSRGVLVAAAAGGLVSSTAVTIANARRAAAGEGSPRLLAAGVALATAMSLFRVFAIVAALRPSLLVLIAPALLTATILASGFAAVLAYWPKAESHDQQMTGFRNPFGFWSVIGFAVSLGAIIVLGRALSLAFGATGAIVGAAVVGIADVDSVAITVTRLTPDTLDPYSAVLAILAAVTTGTLSKLVIGATIGRGWFAAAIAVMSVTCLLAAGAAQWVMLASFSG